MDLNIKKVMTMIRKQLEKEWRDIDFEYALSKDEINVTAEVVLNNHDDNILAKITVYPGGGAIFRAVFDKIEKSPEILELLNEFNREEPFFKAFIRDDDYLELRHYFVCYEEDMFISYAGEFLTRLAGLSEDELLQELTQNTHD